MGKEQQVEELRTFYKGKKVLVTGIQGFKGSWLALLLRELGAEVVGCGLQDQDGLLFPMLDFASLGVRTQVIDVRDRALVDFIREEAPAVAFHLAAQPIVSLGYDDPYLTYSSNVMGTVNFLDGVRSIEHPVSVVNVTTDKVYQNVEKEEGYQEDDRLMGEDPYSSSKSCSELVTFSYKKSFFDNKPAQGKVVSTCRAGNVIGGGDFALNRIIPDMARALKEGKPVTIRNFEGVRPYEHVLDALYAYVLLAAAQAKDPTLAGSYNVGPNEESIMKTRVLTEYFKTQGGLEVIDASQGKAFHEANLLSLDSSKFRKTFSWEPTWASPEAMLEPTWKWYQAWIAGGQNMASVTLAQVREFLHE